MRLDSELKWIILTWNSYEAAKKAISHNLAELDI